MTYLSRIVLFLIAISYFLIAYLQVTAQKIVDSEFLDIDRHFDPVLVQIDDRSHYSDKDINCLARNMYHEAHTENNLLSYYAVAQVTLNRLETGRWGNSICEVVYAKGQFSWTDNKEKLMEKVNDQKYQEAQIVADMVLNLGVRVAVLDKALFYHADYVSPVWADDGYKIARVGRHIFYEKAKKDRMINL